MKLPHRMTWCAGAFLGLLAGCAGVQLPRASLNDDPGALLFNGYTKPDVACFKCHNGDGSGSGRGPSLATRVPKLTDEKIVETMDKGPGIMPSFKDTLTAAEKRQIVLWLRSRFGKAPAPAPAPASGQAPASQGISPVAG
ncbi:MAG: c-type cytochrome [Myxococcales bacterium]